jgi:hypothetical protein
MGIGVVAFWPGEREPEYDGKKLSDWLAVQNERPTEVSDAVRAIGTNGVPILIRWVEYQTPPWRYRLARMYFKVSRFMYSDSLVNILVNGKAKMRSYNSLFAFRILGTNASPAIPELARFVTDARNRDRKAAAQALAHIGGRDALPPLLAALKDKTVPDLDRALIAGAIPYLNYRGVQLTNAVPIMIACLQETNSYVPSLAAYTLGTFLVQPEQCVPALTNAARSNDYRVRRNAIRSLGMFGAEATNAIDAISNALNDPERSVRTEATNALREIAPEVMTNGVTHF